MHARLALGLVSALLAGCVAPPNSYWMPDTRTVERLDYGPWDALLRAHVENGQVDYPALAAAPEFGDFLRALRKARFTRGTSPEQRLAFWMNAYNASAIAGILVGGSPDGLLRRARFFLRERHAVGGEAITLWDLEHERIRGVGDPRVHFAIVGASRSCPRLASEALLPERLDAQLDALTRAFVNDPERNRYDLAQGRAQLSQIFEWYEEDFAVAGESLGGYVARYVEDPQVADALRAGSLEIGFLPYDWSLNGTPLPEE